MPPKLLLQIGFVLIALIVFVIRAAWAAQREREEDEMFQGKRPGGGARRADPNSAWEDQRQLAAAEAERQRETVREHSRSFSQRVAHDVDTSDVQSRIESEVHRKFDERQVGTLDSGAEPVSAAASTTADDQAAWSNDPERLRDAFILREILARPEQRWSETA